LIGGPSRSGKTTIVNELKNNSLYAGLPVEGLLRLHINKYYLFFNIRKKMILNDYLNKSRNISYEKKLTAKPIDYFIKDNEQIINNIPKKIRNVAELIDWSLQIYADDLEKKTWCVCDTHPELYFEKIKKNIPNIKIAVLVRHPLESITAGLYWRTYPQRSIQKSDAIVYRLLLWCITVKHSIKLKKKYPDDVDIIYFNDLFNVDKEKYYSSKYYLSFVNCIENNNNFKKPFFNYDKNFFYSPEGEWEELLDRQEISLINYFCQPLINFFNDENLSDNYKPQFFLRVFVSSIISLSNISPVFAKGIIDWIFVFPIKKYIYNSYNNFKNFVNHIIFLVKGL